MIAMTSPGHTPNLGLFCSLADSDAQTVSSWFLDLWSFFRVSSWAHTSRHSLVTAQSSTPWHAHTKIMYGFG